MANPFSSVSVCLLLLAAIAGNTMAVTETPDDEAAPPAAAETPPKYDSDDAAAVAVINGRAATPGGRRPSVPVPADDGCWESIVRTSPACAHDVLQTLVLRVPSLSRECCDVLARAGDKCVADIFSGFPSGEKILPIVKRVCSLVSVII
uniref:Prolamin-like domain-containing protein n=1 Tax=Leersia perrieri TaxID=77586 RepID=A0A0D9X9B2_9ORYZ